MRSRVRMLLAALLGPVVLLIMFAASSPVGVRMPLTLALAAYLCAHLLFWPPALATRYVGRRLKLRSPIGHIILMATFSAVLSFAMGGIVMYLNPTYGWHELLRDAGVLALCGAGAFVVYRAILVATPGAI
jgi:hypothetical protein